MIKGVVAVSGCMFSGYQSKELLLLTGSISIKVRLGWVRVVRIPRRGSPSGGAPGSALACAGGRRPQRDSAAPRTEPT